MVAWALEACFLFGVSLDVSMITYYTRKTTIVEIVNSRVPECYNSSMAD